MPILRMRNKRLQSTHAQMRLEWFIKGVWEVAPTCDHEKYNKSSFSQMHNGFYYNKQI